MYITNCFIYGFRRRLASRRMARGAPRRRRRRRRSARVISYPRRRRLHLRRSRKSYVTIDGRDDAARPCGAQKNKSARGTLNWAAILGRGARPANFFPVSRRRHHVPARAVDVEIRRRLDLARSRAFPPFLAAPVAGCYCALARARAAFLRTAENSPRPLDANEGATLPAAPQG